MFVFICQLQLGLFKINNRMRVVLFLLILSFSIVKSKINQTFVLKYENYTIPDMSFICLNFNITADISEKCAEQLEVVCGNATLFLTMLDATSKFPYSGLGYASRMDYGNFDQCLSINHNYAGGKILGKHCTAGLVIPDIFGNLSDFDSFYKLSVCKPDGCSANDSTAMSRNLIAELPLIFQDTMCQTVESGTEFRASDIVTLTIFAVVIFIMTTSTIYDIYLHKTQSKSRHPLLLAFSVFSNGRKLLHVSKNSREQIQTFHGLRVLSMMWIIAGHGFVMLQTANVTNVDDRDNWTNHMKAVYITAGPLAVDTFFFISGFLLAFHYFKQKTRTLKAQVLSIPHMFLHRYLRLTPAVLMIYLVTISIFKHLGSGPVWNTGEEYFAEPCRKYWWSFFLYIQNYYNYDDLCLVQTWYLSADMQIFLLSPLILIPISLNLRKSSGFKVTMVGLLILNLFFTFMPMAVKLLARDYDNTYYDTHSRFINYYIGVALAIFMREKKDKPFLYMVKNQHLSIANLIIWIVMLLGMLTIVLCYQEVQMNHGYESQSVFYSLMRPAWCIGLSWIVYSCYHGYGGVVNWILTGPTMQVMGRLTYCMYLTHVSVMAYIVFTPRDRIYFSDYNEFYFWCGHFIVSAIVSIFWTLAFESPLLIIEKFLLGSGNKTSNQSQVPEPQNENKSTEMKKANVY